MRPPRLAVRIAAWRLSADAEFVLGDLEEGFYARGRRHGPLRAVLWYWAQAVRIAASIDTPVLADGRNLKLACRTAIRRPLFACTVIVTLALAIGANAVIFGMVDMLLLRPIPIADPDRVGWVFGVDESRGVSRADMPPADYADFLEARSFSHLTALATAAYTLTGRGDARRLNAFQITPNLFDVWGINVAHGRRLHTADAAAGAAPVALLTNPFWTREYGGDPAVVGQPITLSGTTHTIVGVLGPELNYGDIVTTDVWTPYVSGAPDASRADRRLTVMGLLADGASIQQADAEIKTIARSITRDHPETHASWSARVIPAREGLTSSETWLILALLVVTVAMVLLIACANVTNILLAVMAGRAREIAVRAALGAGRRQIVAQLLSEAFVLAVAGGLLGVATGYAAMKLLSVLARGNFFFDTLAFNYRVAMFAMALAFVAPVLFALIPAMHATRMQVAGGLSEPGSRIAGTSRSRRTRNSLVVAQIALAMTLIVVSTLSLRTMVALMRVDLGFRGDSLAAVRFEVPAWKYRTDDDVRRLVEAAADRLRGVAGATRVAIASAVPALDADVMRPLELEGVPLERGQSRLACQTIAGEDYFETLGIPLIGGRPFDSRDSRGGHPVAVVSRTTADRHLGGVQAALGRRVRFGADGAFATIVGVAADVANPDVDQNPNPIVYLPFAHHPQRQAVVLVSSSEPAAVTAGLRAAMRALDSDVAIDVATFNALIRQEFAATRALVALFVAFGGVALALAASGLYGVIAFVAAQRTREFGVRVALGARPADVRRLMLRQGGGLIAAGLIVGTAGSLALAQVTRGFLFGVSVGDPSTYIAVGALVALTAAVATYVPARRAMRIDPVDALRAD